MNKIPLSKGYFALVDDDMFHELNQYKWYANLKGENVYAERRHINFYLDKDQVKKLTSDNCVYCGQEPNLKSFSEKTYKNRTQYIYNTIDRIDSDKDYSIDNCVTACKTCNISKNVQKHDDFINWIRKVYNYTKENK